MAGEGEPGAPHAPARWERRRWRWSRKCYGLWAIHPLCRAGRGANGLWAIHPLSRASRRTNGLWKINPVCRAGRGAEALG